MEIQYSSFPIFQFSIIPLLSFINELPFNILLVLFVPIMDNTILNYKLPVSHISQLLIMGNNNKRLLKFITQFKK